MADKMPVSDGQWWGRIIESLPEYPHSNESQRSWVEQQLTAALVAEMDSLPRDTQLVVTARYGVNRIENVMLLKQGQQRPDQGGIAAVAGVTDWQPLGYLEDLLDGFHEVVPTTIGRLGNASRAPWCVANSFWSQVAERLTGISSSLEIAVVLRRIPAPSPAAAVIARRRRQAHDESEREEGASFSDDLITAQMFLLGESAATQALSHAWKNETGTNLAPYDALLNAPRHPAGLEAQVQQILNETVPPELAAQLLPIPVLDSHSGVVASRQTYRAHQHTSSVDAAADLILGKSDNGVQAGIPAMSVNQHLLIVGDTGYGKSTTTAALLHQAWTRFRIPFLVIDPLKHDFARLRIEPLHGDERPIRHFALGSRPINLLAVPNGVDAGIFGAIMAEAFNATSDLKGAFPLGHAVAKSAFARLYRSTNSPTFADLRAAFMAETNRDEMRGENGANVRASLNGRLNALTSGPAGEILAGGPNAGIDWAALSSEPTVITFTQVIPREELSAIYSFLIAAHAAWRRANPTAHRHILVLEEAEMVFERGNEVADGMLSNLIATMRGVGQGYFVLSQHPSQLSEGATQLFPNLIAHRLLNTDKPLLDMLDAESADLRGLRPGEFMSLAGPGTTRGSRLRTYEPVQLSPDHPRLGMLPPNHRHLEILGEGGPRRSWCEACPRPCTGSAWLRYSGKAMTAAQRSNDLQEQVIGAMRAAGDAAREEGAGPGSPAALYCATAAAVTALHSNSINDAEAACRAVRDTVDALIRIRSSTNAQAGGDNTGRGMR